MRPACHCLFLHPLLKNARRRRLPSFLSSSSPASPSPDDDAAAGLLLKSVSFTASSSNILAVVGPSSAGKSTLLRILSGRDTGSEIARPGTTVSLNGHAVASRAQLRRLCGFVTQDDNLLPLLTVRETVLFAARFRLRDAATASERHERVDALLQELGLSEVAVVAAKKTEHERSERRWSTRGDFPSRTARVLLRASRRFPKLGKIPNGDRELLEQLQESW